jgi:hypothetical protein
MHLAISNRYFLCSQDFAFSWRNPGALGASAVKASLMPRAETFRAIDSTEVSRNLGDSQAQRLAIKRTPIQPSKTGIQQ